MPEEATIAGPVRGTALPSARKWIQAWTTGYSGGAPELVSCRAPGKGRCSPQGIYRVASLLSGAEPGSNQQLVVWFAGKE